jgi:hypothetical protein
MEKTENEKPRAVAGRVGYFQAFGLKESPAVFPLLKTA